MNEAEGVDRQKDAASQSVSRRLDDLRQLTDAALGYMSLEQMLSELLERIRSVLEVDTAAILLLDEDRRMLVARAARGLEEEVRQGVQIPLARGFAGRVAAQRRPIVIDDLSQADVVNPILRQRGIRSMLGVPLHTEGRVIGVMHIGSLKRRLFGEDDTRLLQLAADRAAMAIDNARVSEQRSVTEIMQRTLLPEALPDIPGLRFSAKYLPAGSGVKIGGDWYDVFQLSNGGLALVIGDVVGHGVLAASVMAEIRTALRAYLFEGHELGEVMSLLNRLLVSMGRNRSATLAIMELDLEREELVAVTAGHLPALIARDDGETYFLESEGGLPLGFSGAASYSTSRYPFPVGSALLLYTDGLIERRDESIEQGFERLRRAAQHAIAGEDASFADRVYRALVADASFDDDMALLTIESVPLESVMELTLNAHTAALAGLRRTVGRWLASMGLGDEQRFDVTVATSEAASNAIEHAYGARDAQFWVRCECDGTEVTISVRDSGRWREPGSVRAGRGRGLVMMNALVDSVDVEYDEAGTTVTLRRSLSATAA
jgi:serine phosphatase RsbU (regulator of sigma subunit)/anti-sigma regulatory factor (Ser/Thr protein kinase)